MSQLGQNPRWPPANRKRRFVYTTLPRVYPLVLVATATDKEKTIWVLNKRNAIVVAVYLAFALFLGSYRLAI